MLGYLSCQRMGLVLLKLRAEQECLIQYTQQLPLHLGGWANCWVISTISVQELPKLT